MRDDSGRRRGLGFCAAALLALCGLAAGLGAGSVTVAGARDLDSASLDVTYLTATTLQVKLADGTVVASGGSIPAGSYMVYVYDANTDANPNFTINGPGVSLSSNLDSTGMGIDQPAVFGPYTFQASASYSVEDTNIGPSSTIGFTTTATSSGSGGSSSGGGSSGGSSGGQSSGTTQTTSSSTTKTVTTPSSGGSTMLGTLSGLVSATGKATLSFAGKAVKTLKPGHYKVVVEDHSKKDGLYVGKSPAHLTMLSGAASVGKSTHTLSLTAGKWFFESSARGPKTSFSVS